MILGDLFLYATIFSYNGKTSISQLKKMEYAYDCYSTQGHSAQLTECPSILDIDKTSWSLDHHRRA